jgi:hypothetical protein
MGIEVNDPTIQKGVDSQIDELDDGSSNTPYLDEYTYIADIAQRSNKYADRVKQAFEAGLPQIGNDEDYGDVLGAQIRAVAAMIAGGLKSKVYVVSMGGFDTHVNQQQIDDEFLIGMHPLLLGRLSKSVAQFQYDMTKLGQADNVVGLTLSEFGRRPNQNGSFGSDHGAASVQFVFGSQVNSAVFGQAPDLVNLNNNGDLRPQIDYRTVYTEILTDWFRMPLDEARNVLEDDSLLPLNVLKAPSGVEEQKSKSTARFVSASPNPFRDKTRIAFRAATSGRVIVEIYTLEGRRVARLHDASVAAGDHSVVFGGDIPAGTYLCRITTASGTDTRAITCLK